jgi:OOP family OmpA-OmpF porin
MRFIFALLAMAAFAVSPAMADDGGFYVGAGVGSFGIDIDDFEEGVNFSGDDTAFKLIGGYKLNQFFGAELEYLDGGTAEDKYSDGADSSLKIGIDVSGFNFSLLGAFPFGEQFDVFAKLGVLMWDADFKATISGPLCDELVKIGESCSGRESDDGSDFSWGIGASWYFMENFGARLEFQGFEIEDADMVDMISLGVTYTF